MSAALEGRHRRRIICAADSRGERVSAQLDTIGGWVLTERAITADKSVAPSISLAPPPSAWLRAEWENGSALGAVFGVGRIRRVD